MLIKTGYKPHEIGVFMIVNWKIPLSVCEVKLDMLKVHGVGVCDCCWDGGYKIAVAKHWTRSQIDYFKAKCSLHNQLIRFKLYADKKRAERYIRKFK